MTSEAEAAAVEKFRAWLRTPPPPAGPEPARVDFPAILAQFTALRHEVNLQTKAARALAEAVQNQPAASATQPDDAAAKGLLDVADSLAAALKQVEKWKVAPDEPVPEPPQPGFFARLFGATPAAPPPNDKLKTLATAAVDGYAISLRKADRALTAAGYEVIAAAGLPFDPACMEAVELSDDAPPGFVAEEVRRGYRKNGTVVRFAQVKVGRG